MKLRLLFILIGFLAAMQAMNFQGVYKEMIICFTIGNLFLIASKFTFKSSEDEGIKSLSSLTMWIAINGVIWFLSSPIFALFLWILAFALNVVELIIRFILEFEEKQNPSTISA